MEGDKKTAQLGIKLSESDMELLKKTSNIVGMKPSAFLREIIRRKALSFAGEIIMERQEAIDEEMQKLKADFDKSKNS